MTTRQKIALALAVVVGVLLVAGSLFLAVGIRSSAHAKPVVAPSTGIVKESVPPPSMSTPVFESRTP